MKTLVTPSRGELAIADLPQPTPAADEVVVRVAAATVNPVDAMVVAGTFHDLGLIEGDQPVGLGWDLVGIVESVGADVATLSVGDRVAGVRTGFAPVVGGISEYVAISAADVARVPDQLATLDAAGIGMNALTAALALDLPGTADGRSLLITGAAGSVGGFAAELAAASGWTVTGLARESDRAFVEGVGARLVTDLTEDATYDVVLDAAPLQPDTGAFRALLPLVADGGEFIGVLGAYPKPDVPGVHASIVAVAPDGQRLGELLGLTADRKLTSRVAGTTSLEEAGKAFDAVTAGGRGRWLVLPSGDLA
jgi:NADPH:quinone reductase-like Zn-dependent oxidoreductase